MKISDIFFNSVAETFSTVLLLKPTMQTENQFDEVFFPERSQKVLIKFGNSWPKAEHLAAKHQHVGQNYTPRAQKNCLIRSFLLENFVSDYGARSTGLESLLFGILAKKFGNLIINAFCKHTETTWWWQFFDQESLFRFLIFSEIEKKNSN